MVSFGASDDRLRLSGGIAEVGGCAAPPASLLCNDAAGLSCSGVLAGESVPWSIASTVGARESPATKRARMADALSYGPPGASPMASGMTEVPATARMHSMPAGSSRAADSPRQSAGRRMDAFMARLGEERAIEAARQPESQASRRARLASLISPEVLARAPVLGRPDASPAALRVLAAPSVSSAHNSASAPAIGRRAFVSRCKPSALEQLSEALLAREREMAASGAYAKKRVAPLTTKPKDPSSGLSAAEYSEEDEELRTSQPDVSGDESPPDGARDLLAVLPPSADRPLRRGAVVSSSGDDAPVCRLAAILSDDSDGDVGEAVDEDSEPCEMVPSDTVAEKMTVPTPGPVPRPAGEKRMKSIYVDAEASEEESGSDCQNTDGEEESGDDDEEMAREMALSGFVADEEERGRSADSHRALALRMAAEQDSAGVALLMERFLPAAALEDVGALAGLRRKYAAPLAHVSESAGAESDFGRMMREAYGNVGAAAPSSEPDAHTSELTDREHCAHASSDVEADVPLSGFGVFLPSVETDVRGNAKCSGGGRGAVACPALIGRLDLLEPAVAEARPRATMTTFVTLTERPDVSRR